MNTAQPDNSLPDTWKRPPLTPYYIFNAVAIAIGMFLLFAACGSTVAGSEASAAAETENMEQIDPPEIDLFMPCRDTAEEIESGRSVVHLSCESAAHTNARARTIEVNGSGDLITDPDQDNNQHTYVIVAPIDVLLSERFYQQRVENESTGKFAIAIVVFNRRCEPVGQYAFVSGPDIDGYHPGYMLSLEELPLENNPCKIEEVNLAETAGEASST